MFEREARDLAVVTRWGIVRSIQRQSVAEHSHAVAIYADQIATFFVWDGDRGALLRYALWHDAMEVISNDIPGPYKRMAKIDDATVAASVGPLMESLFPGLEWLEPQDAAIKAIVKMADDVEALLWLLTERRLGNTTLTSLTDQCIFQARRALDALPFDGVKREQLWVHVMDAITDHREGQFRVIGEKRGKVA